MTTYVFVENATNFSYGIFDQDGHQFGTVIPNGYYSLKLNYSPTFEKLYNFVNNGQSFTIFLGTDGEINRVYPNNTVHLEVKSEEFSNRALIFPPPVKTSNDVPYYRYLQGNHHNKLLITPIGNIFARAKPILAPFVPDRALRLDFV